MEFPDKYKILEINKFSINDYEIVPIRFEDRYKIMHWRNEQMYHLRQNIALSHEEQDNYFMDIIKSLFSTNRPPQLLFSFLKSQECIGYGGLVNINWIDKNAEISFLMNTILETKYFQINWTIFLKLIEDLSFNQLNLKKIYTYAYDLRPKLYDVLESLDYVKEAELKQHLAFKNKFISVVIHSKFNTN